MTKEVIAILRSKVKLEILNNLSEKPMTLIMLAKLLKRPSVSMAVIELNEEEFVKCQNPDADKWRIYEFTSKGKILLKEAKRFL